MSAATMTTTTNDIYNTESQIYISSCTLQLKVKSGDYTWHTEVLTPPLTPAGQETEIAKEHVSSANTAAVVGAAVAGAGVGSALHQHKSTTSKTKPVTMTQAVSNFMQAERCHTEHIENMNQFVSNL